VTQPLKERFRLRRSSEHPGMVWDQGPSGSDFGFLMRRPGGLTEVLLLDPGRYRLESSSSGIGFSFRVSHPPKYRHYWFCDPVLPSALAPAVRCSFCGLRPMTV
jgi:hypothetical protein